jgi:hypothetical protein
MKKMKIKKRTKFGKQIVLLGTPLGAKPHHWEQIPFYLSIFCNLKCEILGFSIVMRRT